MNRAMPSSDTLFYAVCLTLFLLGVCAKKPAKCYQVSYPVCGCDNVTYGNDCKAKAAGRNVRYPGSCKGAMSVPSATLCAEFRPAYHLESVHHMTRCSICSHCFPSLT